MDRPTRLKINPELNPHLVCVLCGGYLIDATTIVECLHSFCKTCIVRYLETSKFCPICDVQVHKTKPLMNIRLDHTLQDIVYKLVPGLFKEEMNRRREFYKDRVGDNLAAMFTETNRPEFYVNEEGEIQRERVIFSEDEEISLALELSTDGKAPRGCSNVKSERKEHGDCRYLLCPAAVTILHLKKFIRMKFNLCDRYQIDIFHTDEELKESYKLMDVAYIYMWRRKGPLRLFYTVYTNPAKRFKKSLTTEVCLEHSVSDTDSHQCVSVKTVEDEEKKKTVLKAGDADNTDKVSAAVLSAISGDTCGKPTQILNTAHESKDENSTKLTELPKTNSKVKLSERMNGTSVDQKEKESVKEGKPQIQIAKTYSNGHTDCVGYNTNGSANIPNGKEKLLTTVTSDVPPENSIVNSSEKDNKTSVEQSNRSNSICQTKQAKDVNTAKTESSDMNSTDTAVMKSLYVTNKSPSKTASTKCSTSSTQTISSSLALKQIPKSQAKSVKQIPKSTTVSNSASNGLTVPCPVIHSSNSLSPLPRNFTSTSLTRTLSSSPTRRKTSSPSRRISSSPNGRGSSASSVSPSAFSLSPSPNGRSFPNSPTIHSFSSTGRALQTSPLARGIFSFPERTFERSLSATERPSINHLPISVPNAHSHSTNSRLNGSVSYSQLQNHSQFNGDVPQDLSMKKKNGEKSKSEKPDKQDKQRNGLLPNGEVDKFAFTDDDDVPPISPRKLHPIKSEPTQST